MKKDISPAVITYSNKLSLSRETVRILTREDLILIAAGACAQTSAISEIPTTRVVISPC